jgi:hypothetical protein
VQDQEQIDTRGGEIAATTVMGQHLDEWNWKEFLPIAFGGHCYYVRQDLTGDQWGPDVMDREIRGIALPNTVADRCQFVTVLGIGPNVGTRPHKAHQVEYGWKDRFAKVSDVKVGDRLLIAQEPGQLDPHGRIKRSPLNWQEELFIEEGLPDAIVED